MNVPDRQLRIEEPPRPVPGRPGEAPGVPSGHDRDARRHANRRDGMRVREQHSVPGQGVEGRRFRSAAIPSVALDIANAKVVGHHVDDVRLRRPGRELPRGAGERKPSSAYRAATGRPTGLPTGNSISRVRRLLRLCGLPASGEGGRDITDGAGLKHCRELVQLGAADVSSLAGPRPHGPTLLRSRCRFQRYCCLF